MSKILSFDKNILLRQTTTKYDKKLGHKAPKKQPHTHTHTHLTALFPFSDNIFGIVMHSATYPGEPVPER